MRCLDVQLHALRYALHASSGFAGVLDFFDYEVFGLVEGGQGVALSGISICHEICFKAAQAGVVTYWRAQIESPKSMGLV